MAVVGDVVIRRSLRVDRIGEVCAGDGPDGPVRVRLAAIDDLDAVASRLVRLGRVGSPAVARVLDRLVDGRGRVAVVTEPDRLTLADRRRLGRLDPATIAGLGATLADGLAALRAAGVGHGAIDASAVGIDDRGRPRWQDAGLLAAAEGETDEVGRLAGLLRDMGRLPGGLRDLAEVTASGMREAPATAAEMALAWRRAAAVEGLPVPPPGSAVELPGLLPPADRRRPRRRPRPPRLLRAETAVLLAAGGVSVLPLARLAPGGASPVLDVSAYRPSHAGQKLTYGYRQRSSLVDRRGTVAVVVRDFATVAGVPTLTLGPADPRASVGLPLGLDGTTLRIQDATLVRSLGGGRGAVRDLVAPLVPGATWSDRRSPQPGFVTEERRTLLGPTRLDEPAGHFDHCLAVRLAVTSTASAVPGTGAVATGTLWFCEGVGLARAVLSGEGEDDIVDLVSRG